MNYRRDIRCDKMHDISVYRCDEMQGSFKESIQKATHLDDRSQYYKLIAQSYISDSQNEEREVYAGSPLTKPRIHAG